jgi:sigma-E factor negative regulatory protein RseB
VQTSAFKSTFLLALLLLSASCGAGADALRQEDLSWLQIMAFAAHQTDYSGTFVYQYGGHIETSRITHIADRDGEHGRLESLDGPRREIIRNNDQVWCDTGNGMVRTELGQGGREFPALLPQQITLLKENYLIKPAEEVRLAGFHAHAMIFQPKDNLRYTHKMWADSVSGLLLKSEVLDERGAAIEQYYFTQLSIGGDIDRKWIILNQPVTGFHDREALHSRRGQKRAEPNGTPHEGDPHTAHPLPPMSVSHVASGWRVDALPSGFKKIAEVRRQMHGKDSPVIQMVFSDGLAGISVFIEKSDNDEDDHTGLSSQGVIQVYTRVLDDHLVTVVGELPPRTVMQVADSVREGGVQQ